MTDISQSIGEDRFDIAGDWLLRLQAEDVSQDEFSAWLQWYEADPLNRAAFEDAQQQFEAVRSLSVEDRSQWAKELTAPPHRGPSSASKGTQKISGISVRIAGWRSSMASLISQRRYAVPFAAAVALVIVTVVVNWQQILFPVQSTKLIATFQTPLATQRVEKLPDGSEVRLGARSSISVNFSGETRYLVLESGEASFKVAKDSARPFIVHAGQVSVRAVGTEFNVRRAADSTAVAVSEGVVDVIQELPESRSHRLVSQHQVRLKAGEEVLIDERTVAIAVKPIDRAAVSAWQAGRLEFVNEPLRLVVATVNRYSSREIVVTDQNLNDLRVTGAISAEHTDEWLRALPEIIPVRVIEISKETVLVSPLAGN